jgi:hypothetical protein
MRKIFNLLNRKSSLNIITILMHVIAVQKVKQLMTMEFGIAINVIMTYVHNALNEISSTFLIRFYFDKNYIFLWVYFSLFILIKKVFIKEINKN